ncbi:cytochrome P450 [Pseudonocardia ailaonensis]|uniref:Cytochrome P450 n=1 Tax=Pseudonocardia ailaonensis TaxID=367279 RepID=A0ABN2N4W4_9PSEU
MSTAHPADARAVVDFDHHSPAFNADPHRAWQELREKCPVAWSENHGGFWVVSDYEGNHEVLKNTDVFTTERSPDDPHYMAVAIPGQPNRETILYPIELDPPNHGPVRRLLNEQLSPAQSRRMLPSIERATTETIDEVIEAGACDLLEDIAGPVPAQVTLDWLGYPQDRIRRAAELFHWLFGYPPSSDEWKQAVASTEVEETLQEVCAARRTEPRDDYISWLLAQEIDGRPVEEEVIVGLCFVLVGGGVDTTTSLTASALVHLDRDRELRQRLIDDPALLVPATEEFLRVYPPLSSTARTVRQDTELRGCPVRTGDRVLVSRYGANYDEKAFPNPEEFVIDRFPNKHVSFGLGPHRCVGAHLARLIFQETMRQILRRMPDYSIDESRLVHYADRGFADGWLSLPAVYTPGPREGSPSSRS